MSADSPQPSYIDPNTKRAFGFFKLVIDFEFDAKFINLIPSVNINLHAGEVEIVWLLFGMYISKK